MSRHRRSGAPTVASVIAEVRRHMTDAEIVRAAQAITIGNDAYLKRLTVAGRPVRLENRGPDARMGRHGGGWDFEVGVQLGRSGIRGTIIVTLGRGSIRIDPRPAS